MTSEREDGIQCVVSLDVGPAGRDDHGRSVSGEGKRVGARLSDAHCWSWMQKSKDGWECLRGKWKRRRSAVSSILSASNSEKTKNASRTALTMRKRRSGLLRMVEIPSESIGHHDREQGMAGEAGCCSGVPPKEMEERDDHEDVLSMEVA